MKLIYAFIALFLIVSDVLAQHAAHSKANIHEFVVEEVLQTTSYTYLLANEKDSLQWLAIPKMEATVGDVYFHIGGMEMRDFKSSELDRIFESVLFMSGVQSADVINADGKDAGKATEAVTSMPDVKDLNITPVEGGITIAELFEHKEKYAGKKVKIQGQVVKYRAHIMGKNWIHLQDGTDFSGDNDLTITSTVEVMVGDIVTIEGVITLDKNFGSGYFYKLIMEEGKEIK